MVQSRSRLPAYLHVHCRCVYVAYSTHTCLHSDVHALRIPARTTVERCNTIPRMNSIRCSRVSKRTPFVRGCFLLRLPHTGHGMHCSVENLCTRWTGPSRTLWPLCTRCKRQPKRGCPTARRSTTLRTRGEVIPSAFCAVESCFAARCGVRHSSYCQLPDRLTTRTLDASAARHKPARLREQHSMKPMRNPRRTPASALLSRPKI
jgi:hypothetical protein